MANQDWVTMYHPETGGIADVAMESFEDHWRQRGWKMLDKDSTDLPKAKLEEIAASRGVDTSDARTKADLVAEIKKEG